MTRRLAFLRPSTVRRRWRHTNRMNRRGARLWKLDARSVLKKGKNRIAIRIYNGSGAGGIHRNPVRFEFEGKNSDLLFPYEFNESKYTNDFFWCW